VLGLDDPGVAFTGWCTAVLFVLAMTLLVVVLLSDRRERRRDRERVLDRAAQARRQELLEQYVRSQVDAVFTDISKD
jgi:heme exporter protein D